MGPVPASKVLLPRFAVAAITLALLSVVPLSLTLLHAQSKPLWFQFDLQPRPLGSGLPNFQIAKDGYDEPLGWMFPQKKQGLPDMVGARLVVKSIQEGRVDLEIAAHNYGTGTTFPTAMFSDKLNLRPVLYSPDQTLTIPIEGGGTLYLREQVLDHQPKLAWGWPLEPRRDQLMIRSPLLVEDDHILANLQGSNALAEGNSQIAFLNSPGNGNFIFGFDKVPGAVEAQANWGQITFKLDGKSYLLKTSAPICGGDQPRTLWVKVRPQLNDRVSLGSGPAALFDAGPDS